ncbi:MAG: lamin tail domain-containing protein [Deltaproteobacteria bacterium]|nr:lamin tail domain-containing protein [Deltaproteobacteria bacterium]
MLNIKLAALAMVLLVSAGCERDPRVAICPELSPGDLVVTEIRGDQSGTDDTLGEWIELYNASSSAIDLTGVAVTVTRLDGGSSARLVFRRAVTVGPKEYVVMGRFFDVTGINLPSYINYGYASDFDSSIYDTGAVEIFSCGTETDEIVYRNLPSTGTYALDGAVDPSAEANDDLEAWCNDELTGDPDATGTPGERNPACP